MEAIILAAGLGLGIRSHSRVSKPLVMLGGDTLLGHNLNLASKIGVTKVIVVVGYKKEPVRDHIRKNRHRWNLDIGIVYNERFTSGSIESLRLGLQKTNNSVIVMNADHIFPKQIIPIIKITAKKVSNIAVFYDTNRKLDLGDMKLLIKNSTVRKISKGLKKSNGGYIGVTYIPKHKVSQYKKIVNGISSANSPLNQKAAEEAIQASVDFGETVEVINIHNLRWIEIDTIEDSQNAKKRISKLLA